MLYTLVLAHGPNCNDGAVAAWAVWRSLERAYQLQLREKGGFYHAHPESSECKCVKDLGFHPNSQDGALLLRKNNEGPLFVFTSPGAHVNPDLVYNEHVLILDLDLGDHLVPIVQSAASVRLIDHHDSTLKTIRQHADKLFGELQPKFSMNVNCAKSESGASLTWKEFHGTHVPEFVNIVRIGDTWSWHEDEDAQDILASMRLHHCFDSFEDIERTYQTWMARRQTYADEGKLCRATEKEIVRNIARQCCVGVLKSSIRDFSVAYVPCNALVSQVASCVRKYALKRGVDVDVCATWNYNAFNGKVSVSLRDAKAGINLADIARSFGGGGHAQAASFRFDGIQHLHEIFAKPEKVVEVVEVPKVVEVAKVEVVEVPKVVEIAKAVEVEAENTNKSVKVKETADTN